MNVVVNGALHRFDEAPTVAELIDALGLAERRLAVEVNREIVPKSQHVEHRLADGDTVEMVQAMGGG